MLMRKCCPSTARIYCCKRDRASAPHPSCNSCANPGALEERFRQPGWMTTVCAPSAKTSLQSQARLSRAANRQRIDAQSGLAYADRYRLAFLPARPHPAVELHVVAHHADLGQHVGAVADQCREIGRSEERRVGKACR